uniref:LacI family DNA-binding transcriptional regulator n=1 Tax=Pararhizobium sp. IMCC3301 TaxID=3067904 RepID=UPI002741703E|nr:LacI family DNA-binding transcriptional regulator [Pararhizobium sp. IMCC3301]
MRIADLASGVVERHVRSRQRGCQTRRYHPIIGPGACPMSTRTLPTLDDVARLAGVSTATVSRCVNLPDRVRQSTKNRVEAAIAELGYTPHFGGMALASNRTNTIGAVIPTMDNAIFARGVQVLQEELSLVGITLLVASSLYDPEKEARQIRALLGRGVDGLILIGRERPQETYRLLADRQIPFVLMWTYSDDLTYSQVGFDNHRAAYDMTQHVISRGHSRIAMIAGTTAGNDRARERVEGVSHAMRNHGLLLAPPMLIETHYSVEHGKLAAQQFLALDERPTAIICGNDVQAAGALKAAHQAGLRVPQDMSIVGFDDIDLAEAVEPGLTTVHVPHRRMGREAAHLIMRMVRNEQPVESIRIATSIVERASLADIS